MSSLYQPFAAVNDTRLSIVTNVAAHLIAQLCELNELRERVRKAKLSARRARRTGHKTEHAFRIKEAGSVSGTFSGV
jgi:hypothetical protein